MTSADARDRLHHMLAAIERLQRIAAGKTFADYVAEELLHDAVERNVERISEASRHLYPELKARAGSIPWREISAIGNILRHDYDGVRDERVWAILHEDLPSLKAAVEGLLQDAGE